MFSNRFSIVVSCYYDLAQGDPKNLILRLCMFYLNTSFILIPHSELETVFCRSVFSSLFENLVKRVKKKKYKKLNCFKCHNTFEYKHKHQTTFKKLHEHIHVHSHIHAYGNLLQTIIEILKSLLNTIITPTTPYKHFLIQGGSISLIWVLVLSRHPL